jgi:hypothetical protein
LSPRPFDPGPRFGKLRPPARKSSDHGKCPVGLPRLRSFAGCGLAGRGRARRKGVGSRLRQPIRPWTAIAENDSRPNLGAPENNPPALPWGRAALITYDGPPLADPGRSAVASSRRDGGVLPRVKSRRAGTQTVESIMTETAGPGWGRGVSARQITTAQASVQVRQLHRPLRGGRTRAVPVPRVPSRWTGLRPWLHSVAPLGGERNPPSQRKSFGFARNQSRTTCPTVGELAQVDSATSPPGARSWVRIVPISVKAETS